MEKITQNIKMNAERKGTLGRIGRLSPLLLMAYLVFGILQTGKLPSSFVDRIIGWYHIVGYPARCAGSLFRLFTECLTRCMGGVFF